MAVTAAKRKQRVTAQMVAHRNELKLFGVISTTGNRVVILFAGIKEEFWFKLNQKPFQTACSSPLDPEDNAVLWRLAHAVRNASLVGYVNKSNHKHRTAIAVAPIKNRRKHRTDADVKAARASMLYQLFMEPGDELPYFQLHSITGQAVCLRVGNTTQQVVFDHTHGHGQLQPSGNHLSLRWWSFICCFSDTLLEAAQKGYRDTNPPSRRTSTSSPTPKHDPRQLQWPM